MAADTVKKEDNTNFEIEFYENILKDQPDFVEALRVLAEIYTKSGKYQEGLRLDQRLIELVPDDAIAYYNLACSYSLLKEIDNSFNAMKKAVELGYNDFSYMHKDPDLENLRQDGRFAKILPKGSE